MSFDSGVLISKGTLLTVAHNIFAIELQAENSNFKFYLGANGVAEEYHEIEAWRYPEEFRTCSPSSKLIFDNAIMKLRKPVNFDKFWPCQWSVNRIC